LVSCSERFIEVLTFAPGFHNPEPFAFLPSRIGMSRIAKKVLAKAEGRGVNLF
jgi:hypothetical protein